MESALLGEHAVDEPVELLDQPDDGLRPDAGTAVEEDRRRACAASRREDLAARHGDRQFLEAHARLHSR